MAKPIRLGKAAGELNVGMTTLVEFLDSKGVKIDASPNTKLAPDQYAMLRVEFAEDQSQKELSQQTAAPKEKKETISIRDTEEKAVEAEPVEEPIAKVEVEKQAPVVKETSTDAATEEKATPTGSKLQVVGTIDLDKINQKTRPDKKKHVKEDSSTKKKDISESSATQPKKEEVKAKSPDVAASVSSPAVPKTEKKPEPKKEIETVRVERKKLTGPNIVGKIVLPVEKPRTSGGGNAEKRKRKRVRKVDVNKAQNQQQRGGGKPGFKPGFKKGPRTPKPEITEADIQKEIKDTLARLSGKGGKSKGAKNRKTKRENVAQKRMEEEAFAELDEKTLKLTEFVYLWS